MRLRCLAKRRCPAKETLKSRSLTYRLIQIPRDAFRTRPSTRTATLQGPLFNNAGAKSAATGMFQDSISNNGRKSSR